MISVRINGEETPLRTDGLGKIADIVELIKANIDPEHMITGILINGKEFQDEDWVATTSRYGTAIIEVQTGTAEGFVSERMGQASEIVRSCFLQFRDARKEFQGGNMQGGNQRLVQAVNTAKAFFDWYATIVELAPADQRKKYEINNHVTEISTICKTICQQQLYQSWWALGETLEKQLEPKLDKLEDHLRQFAVAV